MGWEMSEFSFIGRQAELKSLNDLTQKKAASLVVIKGRRRIGKSRLVAEFAKKYRLLSFSGLVPTEATTAASQKEEFAHQLSKQLNFSGLKADDWGDLFSLLARETKHGRVVILFDEISWMGSKDPDFLGKLKNAWDLEFKKNAELIFILCGSVSSWIDENILKSTGFMGRLSLVLDVRELSLTECNQLLKAGGFRGSAYEKFKLLSVTGGIPRYLEEIKKDRLADENIKDLCFTRSGILFREFNDIFLDIFSRRSELYKKIVASLVNGSKEFSEIVASAGIKKSGYLSQHLSDLIASGFVKRDFTWNIKSSTESKLSHYRLADNYLRFYLKYIEKNRLKIEGDHFNNKSLATLPNLDSIMGLQFENLVLNNRRFIWENLNIHPEDIITDNPYFQRPQLRKKGCQIDYLIQTRANVLYACEIKFSKQEIRTDIINEMRQKLAAFHLPRGFSILPILIHAGGGVSEAIVDQQFFSHIIDFSELLKS